MYIIEHGKSSGLECGGTERVGKLGAVAETAGSSGEAGADAVLLDDGLSWNAVSAQTPCSPEFIAGWKGRFERDRLAGLHARHRGKRRAQGGTKVQARILAWTQQRLPSDGSTHWSTRKLTKALRVSHMMVARVWAEHGLQPHRLEYYMASDDPGKPPSTEKHRISGLYLGPPAPGRVLRGRKDRDSSMEHLYPVLPRSPRRA